MARVRPLALAPVVLFLALGLAFYLGMQRGDPSDIPSAFIGKPAPAMTAEALAGFAAVDPADVTAGQVTLVNFWASWCPPCRAEHPNLLRLAGQGIRIIGVNFNDRASAAQAYLAESGNPFAAVPFDPQGRTAFDWGVAAPPETFILDADGTVLFKFTGPLVGSDYEQRFEPALQAALDGS